MCICMQFQVQQQSEPKFEPTSVSRAMTWLTELYILLWSTDHNKFPFYIVQSVYFCWSSFNILYIQYTAFSFLRFNEISGFNRNASGPLITKCRTWLCRHLMQFFHGPITPTLWLVTLLFVEGCPRTGPLQWLKTLFQIPFAYYLRHWFCPVVT